MKTTRTNNYGYNANTLVSFKIGKGGRFFNAGHLSFIDSDKSIFDGSILGDRQDDLFDKNRDASGRFCKTYLTDGSGCVLMAATEYAEAQKSGKGRLDFDGVYCTYYTITIAECSDKEADAIIAAAGWNNNDLVAAMVEAGVIDEDYLTIETEDEDDE